MNLNESGLSNANADDTNVSDIAAVGEAAAEDVAKR